METTDLVKLPFSKYLWEERAKNRRYVLHHDGGVTFELMIIDPEKKSTINAWPYCLGYEVNRVDFFGLGTYGSNIRLEESEEVDHAIERFMLEEGEKSLRARKIAKLGMRHFDEHKLMIRFLKEGLFHHGTFFDTQEDIESFLKELVCNGEDYEAQLFQLDVNGEPVEYLGKYFHRRGKITFHKEITKEI